MLITIFSIRWQTCLHGKFIWEGRKKAFYLAIDPLNATLSEITLACYNAVGPIEGGMERLEISYRGIIGGGTWAQLIDDNTLRYLLQTLAPRIQRVLNIKL